MATISELLQGCLVQFTSLLNSNELSAHNEVPVQEWKDELGRLRVWAANIGAHQTRQSSLDYRLRDASHIKDQIVKLLERVQELLADLKDVLEEDSDEEPLEDSFEDMGDMSDNESSYSITEVQEIHHGLAETITYLYQMSMTIRKPAQHDRLVGTDKLDAEPFQFWAKQHTCSKYPNADPLAIDRISSAMARQRAILKYRERHHMKLSQGIDSENDGKSTLLSETVATGVFKEMPGRINDLVSDAGVSETSYGGTLLEGNDSDAPKIPPIPKKGADQKPFECPYCFYIITTRNKKAWARHIFHDLMPYVCVFPGCSTPNKLYDSRRQWHHHIQQSHVSKSSTNGTYDCSICKEVSLPTANFQRHVGRHLEELSLFFLPRTDNGEEEEEEEEEEQLETDEEVSVEQIGEKLSDASAYDYPEGQDFEQRDVMQHTASSFKFLPDDNISSQSLQHKNKHYTSSVSTDVSEKDSRETTKSNVEYKRDSPPSLEKYDTIEFREMVKEEVSDRMKLRATRKDAQSGELEDDEEQDFADGNEEREWLKKNIIEERLRGEYWERERLRKKIIEEEERRLGDTNEERVGHRVEPLRIDETAERLQEPQKYEKGLLGRKSNATRFKDAQRRRNFKLAVMEALKEGISRERVCEKFGCNDEEIDEMLRMEAESEKRRAEQGTTGKGKAKEDEVEKEKTQTSIKVHRKYLLPESLIAYNLPWEWDKYDSNYIIIKRHITEDLQEELFGHTRSIRESKVRAQTSSPNAGVKINGPYKNNLYLERKKNRRLA